MYISYNMDTYACMHMYMHVHLYNIYISIHTYILHRRENRKAGIGGNRGLHALSLPLYACMYVCMHACMHVRMYRFGGQG